MASPLIMKFGGTSVGSAERIRGVAAIIAAHSSKPLIVVTSAMTGVTDALIQATEAIARGDESALKQHLHDINERHHTAAHELGLDPSPKYDLGAVLTEMLRELHTTALAACGRSDTSPQMYDMIVSYGERLCIQLLSAAARQAGVNAQPIEATQLIVTTDGFSDAEPLLDTSAVKARQMLTPLIKAGIVPIVTGFIGATTEGAITTLGRGASDYTATILGYCLDAKAVWIWTDVTGVMTADPRLIPEARTIDHLSYHEAAELSYFGAKVLHPLTMVPASLKNIPIHIKNTFEPTAVGTQISGLSADTHGAVKAITTKSGLAMITVQGKRVSGVPVVAAKVFGALADANIEVFLISQASSEHNISFAVKSQAGEHSVTAIREALTGELAEQTIEDVHLRHALSIVAVVGEGMQATSGVVGKVFASLGTSGVDVVAIAQGSSERSISCVVEDGDANTAIKSLHQTFKLVGEKESWLTLPKLLKRK